MVELFYYKHKKSKCIIYNKAGWEKKKASCTKTKNSYKLELTLLYYFKIFNFHFIIFLNFLNEQTDTKSINIYIYISVKSQSVQQSFEAHTT
jgi:hypothetical protein